MRWADVYVPHVSPASMSPASMSRWPRPQQALSLLVARRNAMGRRLPVGSPLIGDDEQRVGLALDAMGRRLRSPRLPGFDVPGVDESMAPAAASSLPSRRSAQRDGPTSPGGVAVDR